MSHSITLPKNYGLFTALVTPFDAAGAVDEAAFERLIEWQISQGVHGLVPAGTTGESPTLTHDEHIKVIRTCVRVASGRVPVMAGVGANATQEAISLTQEAEAAGADMALSVVPYYNKPTQEGLYQHYKAIHDATNLPIVLYDVPGRTVVGLALDTICRLAELPRIYGIKDATGDIARICALHAKLGARLVYYSGEDITAPAFNASGGNGCISVVGNVAPAMAARLQLQTLSGDWDQAAQTQSLLMPLHHTLFAESNPIPVKYAMHKLGFGANMLRLPLVPATHNTQQRIDVAMQLAGIV